MSLYETTFIVRQDVSSAELDEVIAAVERIAEENGSVIRKKEKWGLLNLAYPIKRNNKGHYAHLLIEGGKTLPAALQKEFKRQGDVVIRSLVVEAEKDESAPAKTEPTHMLRERKSAA